MWRGQLSDGLPDHDTPRICLADHLSRNDLLCRSLDKIAFRYHPARIETTTLFLRPTAHQIPVYSPHGSGNGLEQDEQREKKENRPMKPEHLFKPRWIGRPFQGHAVPLYILRDGANFQISIKAKPARSRNQSHRHEVKKVQSKI